MLVSIGHRLVVDIGHIWESVHNKSTHHASLRDFILLDGQRGQSSQSFQLGYLNEAVNIIVHKEQSFQFAEAAQLADIGRGDNVVKTHVLEADLLNGLLEICVVKNF